MVNLIVKTNDENKRIDNFLKKCYPKLSLGALYRYIRTKKIKVNHKKIDINYRLKLNDVISLYINDEFLSTKPILTDFLLAPNSIDVVYEDENILIINKPVGLVVHDDESRTVDTLIHRVQHYLYEKKIWDYQEENNFTPALVHRLDRNTSGLIMIAKNAASLKILNEKIKLHEIEKYYLCKVHGIIKPKCRILSDYLTRDTTNKLVKVTKKPLNNSSEKIITEYRIISTEKDISTIEIKLITGKTHQIRAHMAFIGHPLVGEKKYTTPQYSAVNKNFYQQLVAYKIMFNFHTASGILDYLNHKIVSLKIKF